MLIDQPANNEEQFGMPLEQGYDDALEVQHPYPYPYYPYMRPPFSPFLPLFPFFPYPPFHPYFRYY